MTTVHTMDLDGAQIEYTDSGSGPAVVFVHGVYVSGRVWQRTADALTGFRRIVVTWPLGGHSSPQPGADLSAGAAAERIPAFLEALDLQDVILVGNDTGGGLCLVALASAHPGVARIGRLVLTNCDSYEHFPPGDFATLVSVARRVPFVGRAIMRTLASGPGRRFFLSAVCAQPPPGAREALPMFGGFVTSSGVRRDALRVTVTLEPSLTLAAAPAIASFDRPVLLAWGERDDKLFPMAHAERLAAEFPDARIEVIEGAGTYVMVDRPEELAAAITRFAG